MIDWREDVPKWQQAANIVKKRIESGAYPPGRLVSEHQLVQEFDLARGTVRKAVAWLRDEGLLYTRPNLGSFVGPEPPDQDE